MVGLVNNFTFETGKGRAPPFSIPALHIPLPSFFHELGAPFLFAMRLHSPPLSFCHARRVRFLSLPRPPHAHLISLMCCACLFLSLLSPSHVPLPSFMRCEYLFFSSPSPSHVPLRSTFHALFVLFVFVKHAIADGALTAETFTLIFSNEAVDGLGPGSCCCMRRHSRWV